jgi:serine/threonine-protein kinase
VVFPENNGEFKLIFEWIEGITVREFLNTRSVMSLEQVSKWFAHICSALEHAHRKCIIHRDIKPANLIITTNMEACYLVDFGVSLRQSDLQRLTPSSYPMGTPGYISPEQLRCEEIDASSDIYSLAIVLYECLAGQLPNLGEYQALNTINEAIPPAIDDLILSCFRDKARRLNSAAAFYQELTNALQPHASFSEILKRGSLSEIQLALSQLNSQTYAELKTGQQIFLMAKLKELIKIDQFQMRNAVASLLSELVRVGYKTREKYYRFVIEQSFDYGYEKQYNGNWKGNAQIRDALNNVATLCDELAHKVICETLFNFVENQSLDSKESGYYHDLKILLQNLLLNIHCADEYVERLGEHLEKVIDFLTDAFLRRDSIRHDNGCYPSMG